MGTAVMHGGKDVPVQLSKWRQTLLARECTNMTSERSVGRRVGLERTCTSRLSGVYVLYMSHGVNAGMQRWALHCRQSVHAGVMPHVTAVSHHHCRVWMSR